MKEGERSREPKGAVSCREKRWATVGSPMLRQSRAASHLDVFCLSFPCQQLSLSLKITGYQELSCFVISHFYCVNEISYISLAVP